MDPDSILGAVKAAGDAGNAVSKNSLVKALLLPLAEAYGDDWGDKARARLKAAAERKKQENLKDHLIRAHRNLADDLKPDPELLKNWMEGVEDVDPLDKDISDAWQGVLLAIGSNDLRRKRLLETVRSMTPDEAAAFLTIASKKYPKNATSYRKRLEELGLIHTLMSFVSSASIVGPFTVLSTFSVMFYTISTIPNLDTKVANSLMIDNQQMALFRSTGLVCLVAVFVVYTRMALLPRLTDLGEALAHFATTVRGESSTPAKHGE